MTILTQLNFSKYLWSSFTDYSMVASWRRIYDVKSVSENLFNDLYIYCSIMVSWIKCIHFKRKIRRWKLVNALQFDAQCNNRIWNSFSMGHTYINKIIIFIYWCFRYLCWRNRWTVLCLIQLVQHVRIQRELLFYMFQKQLQAFNWTITTCSVSISF